MGRKHACTTCGECRLWQVHALRVEKTSKHVVEKQAVDLPVLATTAKNIVENTLLTRLCSPHSTQ